MEIIYIPASGETKGCLIGSDIQRIKSSEFHDSALLRYSRSTWKREKKEREKEKEREEKIERDRDDEEILLSTLTLSPLSLRFSLSPSSFRIYSCYICTYTYVLYTYICVSRIEMFDHTRDWPILYFCGDFIFVGPTRRLDKSTLDIERNGQTEMESFSLCGELIYIP